MSEDYYASLSDAELREILKRRNIKCGPITQSTRLMYVSKLARLDEGVLTSSSENSLKRTTRQRSHNSRTSSRLAHKDSSNVTSDASPDLLSTVSNPSSRLHSTPITSVTPPIRRSLLQYPNKYTTSATTTNNNDKNKSDPNIIDFSPYSGSRHIHSDKIIGSPGHTPFAGANKRIAFTRNNMPAAYKPPPPQMEGDWNKNVGLKRPIIPAQSDNITRVAYRSHEAQHFRYDPSSEYSSDNSSSTHTNNIKRRNRRNSSGNFRQSSVQTDSEYENNLDGSNTIDSRLNRTTTNTSSSASNFHSAYHIGSLVLKIFVYGLLFLSLYLISFVAVDWVKQSINSKKENTLEKCILNTLRGPKTYSDCNKVNNHIKTIKTGNNSLSVSFLYSQCEHLLPKDHRLMEGFVSLLKDISHTNALICYDHALNTIHCSDNIFYVAIVPPLLTRVLCGFFLFLTVENLVTVCVSLGLAIFFIYVRSRKHIADSSCCIGLEKSAMFMLKRQRELFLKGFVEEMFLPIVLIRDSLIPPQNRSKLNYYWTIVENKINKNKVVCCEMVQISGMPTKCWKLLSNDTNYEFLLDELEFLPNKRWYPSLIDVKNDIGRLSAKQVNSAPSCFLKIFGAHIAEQEIIPKWEKLVGNALVERCNLAGAIIIHCRVDATNIEGVVYMRTVDENSATIVYNTINSMWLDGKQLTCKFLQRDQYLRKFPDCTNNYNIINKDKSLPSSLN